jgi:hypothetical protein
VITDDEKKAIETFLRQSLNPSPLKYHSFETIRNPDLHPKAPKYITIVTLFNPKTNKYTKHEQNALTVLRAIKRIYRYGKK